MNATVTGVKDKLDDLASRFASVPADLATLKTKVDNLPTKDNMRDTMRNWMLMGTALTTAAVGALGFVLKLAGVL